MQEPNQKGPAADRLSARKDDPPAALGHSQVSAPKIADSSTELWRKYCDSRLRHFALAD